MQQLAETSTSTIPSIRPIDLEMATVLVPSDKDGEAISREIEKTFRLIAHYQRESKLLGILRDALLPKLISGEIDVSKISLTQLNSHLAAR